MNKIVSNYLGYSFFGFAVIFTGYSFLCFGLYWQGLLCLAIGIILSTYDANRDKQHKSIHTNKNEVRK